MAKTKKSYNKNPTVSILTPIYNSKPKYLKEAIKSILNQTYKDFEYLFLNDSPENIEIEKIVLDYQKKDKRIKYFKNEKNLGIAQSTNKLIDIAKGKYIAIFDHDDISLPTRLEKEVKYLDTHPDVGCISCWAQVFGQQDRIIKNPEYDIDIKIELMSRLVIMHTGMMVRKSVLDNYNIRYNPFSTICDHEIIVSLFPYTKFHNIQEILVKYRIHNNNTCRTLIKLADMDRDVLNAQLNLRNKYPVYWEEYKKRHKEKYNIKLFGIIPLYKIKNKNNKLRFRLFGIIPVFKTKKNWVYLFELLPIFKYK